MTKYILISVLLFQIGSKLYSQDTDTKRSFGISASLESGTYGLNIPIWISPRFVLAPTIGINHAGGVGTDITIGAMPKVYLSEPRKIVPFIDFKIAGIFNSPQNTVDKNSKVDLLIGLGYGGEYFFNDNFSVSAEFQGNLTSSDKNSNRFGNPGNINFNLATAITVNIYFTK
jgi:hypothetical protein